MKFKKQTIALAVLLVIAGGYIGMVAKKVAEIDWRLATYDDIRERQSVLTCKTVSITNGHQTINIGAVECLQQLQGSLNEI